MFRYESFPETCTNSPAACSWGPNRLDVFWRRADDTLQHKWFDNNRWEQAKTLPGPIAGNPAVCSWGPNRIDLFWREATGALHHRWGDGFRWSDETIPAQLDSAPAACSWGPNRIDVFWREPAGGLHHKWYNGSPQWGDETLASAELTSAPAACSWGPDRLDVFWRTVDGSLMHRYYDRGWSGDYKHGGIFEGAPVACSWAKDVVDVFVRTASNTIWHRWYDEGWHDWLMREGQTTAAPGVASWGDGRIDLFVAGMDGKLSHGYFGGQPVATKRPYVKTLWGFLRDYTEKDKVERWLSSFAAGLLNNGCSGAMISPHIFLTASHCGGPGTIGRVQFFRVNPFGLPPDDRSQQVTAPYAGRAFPWQDSGIRNPALRGDTVLWWLEDGDDGVPPGIKYGYQEISESDVAIGANAYSFWQNPAIRLDSTLLYSSGEAQSRQTEEGWLGRNTQYRMWTTEGASGSTNLIVDGAHRNRVVGVTQGGEGLIRSVPDAAQFLSEYDADSNGVLDAVEYDWLMTHPIQQFYLFLFDTPFRLSRWGAVPSGSGISGGSRVGSLSGAPTMKGVASTPTVTRYTGGYWNQFARFQPNRTYRLSVVARGEQDSTASNPSSYVKFRSDQSGHEVQFEFRPRSASARFTGRIALGAFSDYRLIVGTNVGTSVSIESLAIVREGMPLGFSGHDERLSWECAHGSMPTSWGPTGVDSFGGAVVGPTTSGWGLRNRFLGLQPNTPYRFRFEVLAVRGAERPGACYARLQDLGGAISSEVRWDFVAGKGHTQEFLGNTGPGDMKSLAFGVDHEAVYYVGDILIEQV